MTVGPARALLARCEQDLQLGNAQRVRRVAVLADRLGGLARRDQLLQVGARQRGERRDQSAARAAAGEHRLLACHLVPEEAVEQLEDVDELLAEEEAAAEVEEDEEVVVTPAAEAPPANWGPVPALVLAPCVIIMFLVSLMAFELILTTNGYHASNRPSWENTS